VKIRRGPATVSEGASLQITTRPSAGEGEAPSESARCDSLLPSQETYPRVLRSTFCDDGKCALESFGFLRSFPRAIFVAIVSPPRSPAEATSWLVPSFAVRIFGDASATYRLVRQHAIVVAINNVFDSFYDEKLGYPLQSASFRLSYPLGF
jgi:hypothetical protein